MKLIKTRRPSRAKNFFRRATVLATTIALMSLIPCKAKAETVLFPKQYPNPAMVGSYPNFTDAGLHGNLAI